MGAMISGSDDFTRIIAEAEWKKRELEKIRARNRTLRGAQLTESTRLRLVPGERKPSPGEVVAGAVEARLAELRATAIQPTRALPLGEETVTNREPVKLFGFTLWHRTVTRPTINTAVRRMTDETVR